MGEYEAGKEKSQYTHYKKLDYTTGQKQLMSETEFRIRNINVVAVSLHGEFIMAEKINRSRF